MSRSNPVVVIAAVSFLVVLVVSSFLLVRELLPVPYYSAHYISLAEDTVEGEGYETSCPYDLPPGCYLVSTDADNPRALARIVEDIVRKDNVWSTHGVDVLYFEIKDTSGAIDIGSAYAFRNDAIQEDWMDDNATAQDDALVDDTVIDGVYVRTPTSEY